ncbi:MAG: D-alanine--poly(phosphoribitol) ligase subunit 2 [Lachnospiraceae bacterium]|nr:D-alanine--poly(phosphoribitol) ligase subunit 2 [Lachnospiraceae bacterium]
MTKEDILRLLSEVCDTKLPADDDIDLIESGILDSYAMIELFSKFEDLGYDIQPTRIDRNKLRSVQGIWELLE